MSRTGPARLLGQTDAVVTVVMTHGPGTVTSRVPVTVSTWPPGSVTLKMFAGGARAAEDHPQEGLPGQRSIDIALTFQEASY